MTPPSFLETPVYNWSPGSRGPPLLVSASEASTRSSDHAGHPRSASGDSASAVPAPRQVSTASEGPGEPRLLSLIPDTSLSPSAREHGAPPSCYPPTQRSVSEAHSELAPERSGQHGGHSLEFSGSPPAPQQQGRHAAAFSSQSSASHATDLPSGPPLPRDAVVSVVQSSPRAAAGHYDCVRCGNSTSSSFDHACPKCGAVVCLACLDDLRFILHSFRCPRCQNEAESQAALAAELLLINAYRSTSRVLGNLGSSLQRAFGLGGTAPEPEAPASEPTDLPVRKASWARKDAPGIQEARPVSGLAPSTSSLFVPPEARIEVSQPPDGVAPEQRTRLPADWRRGGGEAATGRGPNSGETPPTPCLSGLGHRPMYARDGPLYFGP